MQVGEIKKEALPDTQTVQGHSLLLDNVAPLRHVQTVQELVDVSDTHPTRGKYWIQRTLRISLFRTRQICWMSAALWETPSRELPESWSSSLTLGEGITSTPGWAVTRRTYFSPKKLLGKPRQYDHSGDRRAVIPYRISSSARSVSLFFSMLTLMGK